MWDRDDFVDADGKAWPAKNGKTGYSNYLAERSQGRWIDQQGLSKGSRQSFRTVASALPIDPRVIEEAKKKQKKPMPFKRQCTDASRMEGWNVRRSKTRHKKL